MFRDTWPGFVDTRGRLFIPAGIRKRFEGINVVYVRKEACLVHFYAKEVDGSVPVKIQKRYRKNKRWERISSVVIQIPRQFWAYGVKVAVSLRGEGHYFYLKEENFIQ